jgi:threonine 3-dehydrogenase
MKVLLKSQPTRGAEISSAAIPEPGYGEVLVKVKATSICGTDLHIYRWDEWASSSMKLPRIFGHEFAGEITEVGDGVREAKPGEYVSAETHFVCGRCLQCRTGQAHVCRFTKILGIDVDGVFAEYAVIPESNLIRCHSSIAPEIASVQEPFGNAVHSVFADDILGATVAVFGCGPIGLFSVGLAATYGARRVIAIEPQHYRLELAEKMGAVDILNPNEVDVVQKILSLTEDQGGVDVVLEMSGNEKAITQAFRVLRPGGWISLLGIPHRKVELDLSRDIIFKGLRVYGIVGRRMYESWHRTQGILSSGRLDITPIITHTFPLEEFEEAFSLIEAGRCGKIVLTP